MNTSFSLLIIEGLTEDGQRFRPSDWIDRLIDAVSVYGSDRRVRIRPCTGPERRQQQVVFLQAQMVDGQKCLRVDGRLRDANPAGYDYLIEFILSNRLRYTMRD